MDQNEVLETLSAAKSYLNRLEQIEEDILNAEKQIKETSSKTVVEIETIFDNLIENITKILKERRNCLISKAQNVEKEALEPLSECHDVIQQKKESTNRLVEQGELLLNGCLSNLIEFSHKSSKLGCLPEIPQLKEVPYISFQRQPKQESELQSICAQLGEVSRIAPIQISKLIAKPGAILVEWQSVADEDKLVDIQEFRLQRAFGDVLRNTHLHQNFTDCFRGLETQFLVRDLQLTQGYSFRVCCKFEGSFDWSPWSLPQVAATSLPAFSWAKNEDYVLVNDCKIAKALADNASVLVSDGAQFCAGHSVEFTFLEFDKSASVGIISEIVECKNIKGAENHFILDSCGGIFVNGVKKATKLPEFKKGIKICFTCDFVTDQKMRINIDACDKRVTYEWIVGKNAQFYFAAVLNSPNCKIMVE